MPPLHLRFLLAMIVAKVGSAAAAVHRSRWRSMHNVPTLFVPNAPHSTTPMQYVPSSSLPSASPFPHSMRIRRSGLQRCTSTSSTLGVSSGMTANEMQMRDDVLQMVNAAIKAVDPEVAVRNRLKVEQADKQIVLVAKQNRDDASGLVYDLSAYDNIRIASFGKASAAMALAVAETLSDSFSTANTPVPEVDGVVVIKDDHATEEEMRTLKEKHNIVVRDASHPVPDARSVAAADEILQLAASSDARTLIIACISGGGSALFCSPRDGLTLEDLMDTNTHLLESGTPIEYMNVIRKRLEKGKGGKLAATAYPATVLSLVLSDIIGDPLDLIASGPTVPDPSGWDDAWRLVEEFSLDAGGDHELPPAVLDLLQRGKDGQVDDTPKSSHPAFSKNGGEQKLSETILVGNNYSALMAAADEAKSLGYNPVVLGTRVDGEALCVAGSYVSMAEMLSRQRQGESSKFSIASLPAALIAGGETIVTLPPLCKGKGGRNQELALSAAMKMTDIGLRDVVLASVGTDGTDGPTDAAGGIIYGGLINADNIDGAKDALRNHDAYTFLESAEDALVKTGPTGTNVADVCICVVK